MLPDDHHQEETEATEETSQKPQVADDDEMVDSTIYNDLITSLNIISNGRHIAIQNPDLRVRIEHFLNYISSITVPEGHVKCLTTKPSCMKLTPTHPTSRVLESKRFEDFVYVRSQMGYMCGKYFVIEIPSRTIILPSQRLGYYDHLLEEREEDGHNPEETISESYLGTLYVLKKAVQTSIDEDPDFTQGLSPFIERAKEAQRQYNDSLLVDIDIKPLAPEESDQNAEVANVANTPNEAESIVQPVTSRNMTEAERAPVKDVSVLGRDKNDYKRALDEYNQQRASAQAGLKKALSAKAEFEAILKRPQPKSKEELEAEAEAAADRMVLIDFMVERPVEDEIPQLESNQYLSEYLKLTPVLRVCAKCGNSDHSNHRCSFESALDGNKRNKTDPSKYEGCDWFTPDADSLAAQGVHGLLTCMYPYCRDRESHVVATCPAMHGRCATCRTRGHDNKVVETLNSLDGSTIKTVNCPVVQQQLLQIEGNQGKVEGATWRNLQEKFEQLANYGEFTRYRFAQPMAGWFPVYSEKDGRVLKAIGYRWLMRVSADKSVMLLSRFSESCQTLIGGPPFKTFTDSEWELINRRRDAKRSADKIDKLEAKKMKTSNHMNPSVQGAAKVPRQTLASNATFSIPPVDYSQPPPKKSYAMASAGPAVPQPQQRPQPASAARGSRHQSPRTRYRSNRPPHKAPTSQPTPSTSGSTYRPPSAGHTVHQQRLRVTAKNAKAFHFDCTEANKYFPQGAAANPRPYRPAYHPREYANWDKECRDAAKSNSAVSTKDSEPSKPKPSTSKNFTFEDLR